MNQPHPSKDPNPVRPRTLFLAAVVCYVVEFALRPILGEGAIGTGIALAGGIFLIWSIVAGIQAARRTRRQTHQ